VGLRPITPVAFILLLAAGLAPAFAAAEPGPRGPDIPVTTMSIPECPAVAMGPSGDFEVVWTLYSSGSHPYAQGTFAQHFDPQGRPTHAAAIRLDSPRNGETARVSIVALPGSGYFVSWLEYRGTRSAVAGRFLSAEGRPTGPAVLLARNTIPLALAVVNDSLLVAREDLGAQQRLLIQRYDFEGHALGEVKDLGINVNAAVSLAPLSDGFVAAWVRFFHSSYIVAAQRFSPAGEPLGAMLRVNQSRFEGSLGGARSASNGDDRFAVAWTTRVGFVDPQSGQLVGGDETRTRLFDVDGASSAEAHPNQLSTGNQQTTGLAMDGRGVTLVTWQSDRNLAATLVDVAGRFLDPDGQLASKAFPISQDLAGDDLCPVAATNGSDAWVVAWLKQSVGIFARRVELGE